jgi:hypothetical protein
MEKEKKKKTQNTNCGKDGEQLEVT